MTLDRSERQKLGIQKWVAAGCKATLQWSTGVGKTRAAIMAIKGFFNKNPGKLVTVVIPTEYLKLQWIQELNKNGLTQVRVEIINSAVKIDEYIDFLILDECHRIPSETFYAIFEKRTPKMVLGLSATFNRLDGRHELLNKFCPVCDVISIKEAVTNKWLSPYQEYKVLIDPPDIEEYKELNKSFHETFAIFDFDFNLAMNCLTNIINRRIYAKKLGMSAKDMDGVVFTWQRALKGRKAFVMNHPKKIEIARKILAARPNSKAITFSATIAQAEKIGGGYVVHSGKTKKKNRMTLAEFSQIKSGAIHTAKSLDEGSDIPGLNLGIILCNTSSPTQKTQRVGRIIRYVEGKSAEMFTLVIKGTMEEGWFNNSTSGQNYIEIDEFELDEILNGNLSDNIEQEGKDVDQLFRL